MSNDISIKVNIGDRMYPLRIKANEEENVRKAAKLLNEKMAFFNANFSIKDKIDGLAMAALEYAVDTLNKPNIPTETVSVEIDLSPIENQLTDIESVLS
jgi:cell division protein ZapA